jgi:hypothetical protein
MTESEVRQVLLVQAHESAAAGGETALWTAADRDWATRVARETAGPGVPFERFLVERARHALERLLPRDTAGRRWLTRRGWRPLWVVVVVLAAFALGVAVDHLGAPTRVDLLMPALWAVVAWNVAVVMALLLPRRPGALRRALAGRWLEDASAPAALWARAAAPLALARAALLLHAAALSLAGGIVAGMYLRGLVLDYRAGWQSTFLEPPHVQLLLETLLAPARAVTGIALPDVAPLRVAPGAAATAGAAPWIHLYAATLALFVGLPRGLLLVAAALRSAWLARRLPLALDTPYFEALRRRQAGGRAQVAVWPHAAPLSAPAALGLRALLAGVFDDGLDLQLRPPVAYGDEELAGRADAGAAGGSTLRVALFDLGATPEAEVQGRLLQALAAGGGGRVLAVVDEAAFRRRFANLPERLAERRAAWQRLCSAQGVALLCADLESPDVAADGAALQAALQAAAPATA